MNHYQSNTTELGLVPKSFLISTAEEASTISQVMINNLENESRLAFMALSSEVREAWGTK